VSSWTEVTVENVDGDEIDYAMVEVLLTEHVGMDFFDGDSPHHPPGRPPEWLPARAVVVASQHGKYMVDADWPDVSRRLIEQLGNVQLTVVEEWDDEGPGRDSTVYEDGKVVEAESTSMRDVNDALAAVLDVSQPPVVLTWQEVFDDNQAPEGSRFIVAPPKDGAK
jgi:hypothetical protein